MLYSTKTQFNDKIKYRLKIGNLTLTSSSKGIIWENEELLSKDKERLKEDLDIKVEKLTFHIPPITTEPKIEVYKEREEKIKKNLIEPLKKFEETYTPVKVIYE